jgi:hypothetical protein
MRRVLVAASVLSAALAGPASGQTGLAVPAGAGALAAPATVERDARGRATVRAVRITEPLRLDGRLDEEVYRITPPMDGFLQQVPDEGAPATQPTEMWVFFDDENLYVSARCIETEPGRLTANELRRDGSAISQNDNFGVVLDTFLDRRNGYYFQTTPIGALRDASVTDGVNNSNWSTVWEVRTTRSDEGYIVEMAIPFKSLRYRGGGPQTWGINARREIQWNTESSMLSQVPASYGGTWTQLAAAGTLVGLETPAQSLNLELKPYAVSSLTTDREARVPFSNDTKANAGIDLKYGVTRGLTADLTVNTDFAQVEEDLQQVNLTRFDLFYPDKREFFLEGQGIFDFGGQASQNARTATVPILFFSRRIGLSAGQSVPVIAGGRMTGKAGNFDIGGLALATDDKPSAGALQTTFSAVRIKRNVLRRSSIGMITTGRWPAVSGIDSNAAAGIDADFRFFDNVQATAYWARTSSADRADGTSYRARFLYGGDRYGAEVERLVIGPGFNPEVGFVRRGDLALTSLSGRFSPRLRQGGFARKLTWQTDLDYITDAGGDVLEDRVASAQFGAELNSGDSFNVTATRQYELLPANFTIARGVVVPAGGYRYDTLNASYNLAQKRLVAGNVSASYGSFYEGTRTTARYTGRLGFSAYFAIEPSLTFNWVRLPFGDFDASLVGMRVLVSPTARLGFSSLTQFNPSANSLAFSVRTRWEYSPGSDLYVVYSDGRNTAASGIPALLTRSVAIKATRLLRF